MKQPPQMPIPIQSTQSYKLINVATYKDSKTKCNVIFFKLKRPITWIVRMTEPTVAFKIPTARHFFMLVWLWLLSLWLLLVIFVRGSCCWPVKIWLFTRQSQDPNERLSTLLVSRIVANMVTSSRSTVSNFYYELWKSGRENEDLEIEEILYQKRVTIADVLQRRQPDGLQVYLHQRVIITGCYRSEIFPFDSYHFIFGLHVNHPTKNQNWLRRHDEGIVM